MLLMSPLGQDEPPMTPIEREYRDQLELKANAIYHLIKDDNLMPIMDALRPLTAGERAFVQKYVADLDAELRPPDSTLYKGRLVQAAINGLSGKRPLWARAVILIFQGAAIGLGFYLADRVLRDRK